MARAFLIVMDSVGIGGAPDAAAFFNGDVPDSGANTLGHIAQWCARHRAEGPLRLPVLAGLGLGAALELASGMKRPELSTEVSGTWGVATEVSAGKDTPSGHWELAGLPVPWDWRYFPDREDSFPPEVIEAVCNAAGVEGILGNCHASGTEIIARLGEAHQDTGWPICYTSADSVFQIAAHVDSFGLDRLLSLCEAIAPMLHQMRVGRVIARPFRGTPMGYERTADRHDYAIPPPGPVLMNKVKGRVYAVGKIGDIFSMAGVDEVRKGDDRSLMGHVEDLVKGAEAGSLTFANFVEFDSLYGHRRDPGGYAGHLEWFDRAFGRVMGHLREGDLMVITADHGNDPTWVGTDHTRERVPVLVAGQGDGLLGHIGFAQVSDLILNHLHRWQ